MIIVSVVLCFVVCVLFCCVWFYRLLVIRVFYVFIYLFI